MKNQKDKESGQDVTKSAAEIMAKAIFDGIAGELVLYQDSKGGITCANPLHAVKLYLDYMLRARELAIRVAELKKKEKGGGGGIRIVLPSIPVDPLLRPGQKPRPLRLLGQDPAKPLHDATGAATDAWEASQTDKWPTPASGSNALVDRFAKGLAGRLSSPIPNGIRYESPLPYLKIALDWNI